ncbi:carbon-nitrogen hydrolase family protein [Mesorhizobium sp. CU2]|uniref:carbon-nitrogen hydrolase family protein n=1 Tax=unclassified Mesorhizobium TaxID=325217 RepID=UPI00112A62AE|nr:MULTISPECIES: carbon-nitrogen hydrolase family protein [unclassified Mesorhizobium]TPN80485.1 carbon-nitrogen hydrolase family protein [Mesorhizobium sp. CU3]TPO11949.1 carbon-nitrogen hydrolase family protein [Mesorhizobium sp. CU2]
MTTCAFVEWPEGLAPRGREWDEIRRQVESARPNILVTNELPFGAWIAGASLFDRDVAAGSVALHEQGLEALNALGVPTVISSRPVWAGDRLANEAFVLANGKPRPLHRKQLFPEEEGWHEETWFKGDASGFIVSDIGDLEVGVLLCTELMFNEHARHYGRAGASLIVVPRATSISQDKWFAAGAMGAIVSGSFIVSSNRVGSSAGNPSFGGRGFAFAPDGTLVAQTSPSRTLAVIDIDPAAALRQKTLYPCNVVERRFI